MKKQPLFDVSHFNRIADKYNIPWIDRIPLIESDLLGQQGMDRRRLVPQTARPMERLPPQRPIRRIHGRGYVRAVCSVPCRTSFPAERLATE